jgi:hypothetical protein
MITPGAPESLNTFVVQVGPPAPPSPPLPPAPELLLAAPPPPLLAVELAPPPPLLAVVLAAPPPDALELAPSASKSLRPEMA